MLQHEFPDALLTEEKLNSETVEKYADAELVSCFIYSSLKKEIIDKLSNLKYIATRSTGYDHIDLSYCKEKNIVVANVPEYGSNTVAEHTFALLLSLTRKIYQSVNQAKNLNFEHAQIRGIDLCGKTIGIIGLGKIGQQVLRIAKGFGMEVLVVNRTQSSELRTQYSFMYTDLPTLMRHSDVVTLHLPLSEQTKHIINKNNILHGKSGSYLINTARGGLIETEAIILGLDKGILAGVGLDVLEEENDLSEEVDVLTSDFRQNVNLKNLIFNHILMNHPKVLITPHNAFNSQEALMRILKTTITNIHSFISHQPANTVTA